MTKVNNSETIQLIREAAQIQEGLDNTPDQLSAQIVPVIDVNPRNNKRINLTVDSSSTVTGTSTITTVPSDRDTLLAGLTFGYIKDAACDQATGTLNVTAQLANGATKSIIRFPVITLTAQTAHQTVIFPQPLLLLRGGNIVWAASFTAGVLVRSIVAYFIVVDNSNG